MRPLGLLLCVALAAACSDGVGTEEQGTARHPVTLRVWAFGREGEVLEGVLAPFARAHPEIRLRVQQIPFSAAHEKLLTAFVGDAPPDVALLGNTWVPEFAALGALAPLDRYLTPRSGIAPADYFPGIWRTNIIADTLYGIPWYVDTRLLFYRSDLLADAGYADPPVTWDGWRAAMQRIRARSGGSTYGVLLPINEWQPLIALAVANGAPLLRDGGRYGDFEESRFRAAFAFYLGLFRDSLAPPLSDVQVANRYQSFSRGEFAFTITGPWDIGEYERRLPAALAGRWRTAPMPAPDGVAFPGASLAGGGSLVVFRRSRATSAAWSLIEFLSEPARQGAFAALTGDLPTRMSAWRDTSSGLDTNRYARPFRVQLEHLAAVPMVPEWEEIAATVADHAASAARGAVTADAALAALDRDVDRLLEKRRWLLAHQRGESDAGRVSQ